MLYSFYHLLQNYIIQAIYPNRHFISSLKIIRETKQSILILPCKYVLMSLLISNEICKLCEENVMKI